MNFKIFISYSTKDLDQVELLRQQLSDTAIEVFVAEHSIKPSEDLEHKITSAIKSCDLFVVLWSENAEASGWVSQEIGHARAFKKTILPLVLHQSISPPGFISNLKYLSVYKDQESALKQAREVVIEAYKTKLALYTSAKEAERKQKEQESMFLLGAGAFLLWAFSK